MPEIFCIGEPLFEFNQQDDGRYLPGFGGDTANCAVAAARQGASVGYFTRLGADTFGRDWMQLWQQEGIQTSSVLIQQDGQTGIYFVTHGDNGHEFSYRRAGSAASQMTPADLPKESIRAAQILHVSGISQAISPSASSTVTEAISIARDADTLVSYDTNLRTQLWPLDQAREVIHDSMSRCDIALPSLDDAAALTGLDRADEMADFYLSLGARIVALTMGRDGTLVATAEKRQQIAPYPVDAVDATAAGDTFDGAFLAHYLRSKDPFEAARFANAAAALSTQGFGAVAPMPTRAQVDHFLATRAHGGEQ
jgi:2-dehydro-3-deoxygluconokinase